MPRVTEAYRQARRDQIAAAALRVVGRHGVAETSMALIAEECGLSTGALYVNFENKADLARYVATHLLGWRTEPLEQLASSGRLSTPAQVLRKLLDLLSDDPQLPASVVLQFWSQATVEPDLYAVMADHVERLRAVVEQALRPWAATTTGDPELARRTSQALLMICQGFLANRCLYGWLDADEFAETVVSSLAHQDSAVLATGVATRS